MDYDHTKSVTARKCNSVVYSSTSLYLAVLCKILIFLFSFYQTADLSLFFNAITLHILRNKSFSQIVSNVFMLLFFVDSQYFSWMCSSSCIEVA